MAWAFRSAGGQQRIIEDEFTHQRHSDFLAFVKKLLAPNDPTEVFGPVAITIWSLDDHERLDTDRDGKPCDEQVTFCRSCQIGERPLPILRILERPAREDKIVFPVET